MLEKNIDYLIRVARAHTLVTKESRRMGWPDLESYSLKQAELRLAEAEKELERIMSCQN